MLGSPRLSNLLIPWLLCAAGAWGGGEAWRPAEGVLALRALSGRRAVAPLASSTPPSFDLELEVSWGSLGKGAGGVEVIVGPHAFGSSGYRVMAGTEPPVASECRAPRLEPGRWEAVELRVRRPAPGSGPGAWLEWWLGGRLVVRCAADGGATQDVWLVAAPGAEALVRRCRLRAAPEEARPAALPVLVYPAPAYRFDGRLVADGAASGGQAVEAAGLGGGTWLLRGHNALLGAGGPYVASFGLRGVEGSGNAWLEVARVEGPAIARLAARLEELPAGRYARLQVPFHYEAGTPVEFRIAAERGRLRVDEVVVEGGPGGGRVPRDAAGGAGVPLVRERRARPLVQVWGKAHKQGDAGLRIVRLARRLAEGGWYEFSAIWESQAARLDDVAADLWVACRDDWGIVRVLDLGAAYDAVPQGRQATAGWLDPTLVARYGSPVALFAVLYHRGAPVAAGWRKWGIPVDDRYIVEARQAGRLRPAHGAAGGLTE